MRTTRRLLSALALTVAGLAMAPSAAFANTAAPAPAPSPQSKLQAAQRDSAPPLKTQQKTAAQPDSGISPQSIGIEEAWPDSYRYGSCAGYTTYAHLSDYVRAGITSGTVSGNSKVWWLGPGNASSIHLKDSFSVSGAATYWNSPGGSWWVIGSSLSYERTTGSDTWQNNHYYSLSYTGFLGYYSHSTYGDVYAAGRACSVSTSASAWF